MSKLILIFSHELTRGQIEDAKVSLDIDEFVYLPSDLQKLWQNIPPDQLSIINYLEPFYKFIKDNTDKEDYILVQGDFGATYLMVNFVLSLGLIPVYATTERKMIEKHMPDDTVRSEYIFKHRIFRKYEIIDKRIDEYNKELKL